MTWWCEGVQLSTETMNTRDNLVSSCSNNTRKWSGKGGPLMVCEFQHHTSHFCLWHTQRWWLYLIQNIWRRFAFSISKDPKAPPQPFIQLAVASFVFRPRTPRERLHFFNQSHPYLKSLTFPTPTPRPAKCLQDFWPGSLLHALKLF